MCKQDLAATCVLRQATVIMPITMVLGNIADHFMTMDLLPNHAVVHLIHSATSKYLIVYVMCRRHHIIMNTTRQLVGVSSSFLS